MGKTLTAIKVISLESSTDRRNAFTQMAMGAAVEWSFFPACTGIVEPMTYNDRAATRRSGRPMTVSEIGCYASHYKLWEWLANSDYDQAIIFEDDIMIDWAMMEKLAEIRFGDYGIDLLRFYATHPFKWKLIKHRLLSAHTHLVRLAGATYGGQGYLITKAAARVLVSKYATISAPVDWVLMWYWEHRLINYFLFPAPVIERYAPSTIGGERHAMAGPHALDRLIYRGWQWRDKIARAYAELFVIKKYPLGPQVGVNEVFIKGRE